MRRLPPRHRPSSCIDNATPRAAHAQLRVESLEERRLMTASATPDVSELSVTSSVPVGLTPSEVSTAYSFNSITFKGGVAGNGSGQTIAIVNAYGDPNIAADLAKFDSTFGLAPANLKVVNEHGGAAQPVTSPSWSLETALDVEWAHAIAPGATILLVESSTASLSDLLTAVNYARNAAGVSVVSMSWGTSEFASETSYDSDFTTPAGHIGITFVAASGDNGSPSGWPALSNNVLAVGGTTLTLGAGNTDLSETAWASSGGSTSLYESEASYQASVQSTGKRTGPDVSYDANPNTGFAVYDSISLNGHSGWFEVGGTSAGTPQWAGLLAIANQGRVLSGEATLSGGQAAIYALSSSDFHDVTSGSNGAYSAKVGYDEVTGRGTPIANLVVAGLVNYGVVAPPPKTVVISPSPAPTPAPAPTPPAPAPTPHPTPTPTGGSTSSSSGSSSSSSSSSKGSSKIPGPILARDQFFAGVGAAAASPSPGNVSAAQSSTSSVGAAEAGNTTPHDAASKLRGDIFSLSAR